MTSFWHDPPTRVLRPATQWKLLAICCIPVGWFLGLIGALLLLSWGADRRLLSVEALCTIIIACVPALAVWRYAVRIDDDGIWRRRFVRWDLWPWTAFAEGKIEDRLEPDSFLFPEKPWYWRRLNLDVLAERDRSLVRDQICRFRK
jgi:hypothetical protein